MIQKMIILVIMCFFWIESFAQYQSLFGSFETSWNVLHQNPATYNTDSLVVGTDTVISQKTYKKLIFYHLHHDDNVPASYEALAFLREDPATGKGWILFDISGPEQLFMDLSLQINDSFSVGGLDYPVDSVYLKDGRKHVRVQYGYPVFSDYPVSAGYLTFIEGVGTTFGFTYNFQNSGLGGYPTDHYYPFLLCGWQDNEHVYTHENTNPFFDGCYKEDTIVGILDDHQSTLESVRIFPNPATEILTIKTNSGVLIESVELMDFSGKINYSLSKLSETERSIDVGNLSDGVYCVRIFLSDNNWVTRKIVLKH